MEQQGALDLPLITEATNEFYRQVYANGDLGHIFKGYNMVVLRRHVSYFILQLTAFDTPVSEPQIEYLRKVHGPVIEERGATQRHFDILASLLITSLRSAGAQGSALLTVQSKLRPLRDIFPPHASASACGSQAGSSLNSVDGAIVLQERSSSREQHAQHGKQQQQQQRSPEPPQQQLAGKDAGAQEQSVLSARQPRGQQHSPCTQQQQQPQQVPCATCTPVPGAEQQQKCCQHDKQQSAPQQQQQQLPVCCPAAKQVVPVAEQQQQQQDQLLSAHMAPMQPQSSSKQQQQQQLQQELNATVPRQPWWKCFAICR